MGTKTLLPAELDCIVVAPVTPIVAAGVDFLRQAFDADQEIAAPRPDVVLPGILPLAGVELSSADQMAQAIDQQLELMREILPVQRTALALLQRDFSGYEQYPGAEWHSEVATQLEQRLQPLEAPVRQRLLQTYAMPLLVARPVSSAGSAAH